MRALVLGVLLCCLPFAVACDPYRTVKVRFAREFNCREELKVKNLGGGASRVSGCGQTASYVCSGNACAREYTREDEERQQQRWETPAPTQQRTDWSQVQVARTAQGARIFRAKIASKTMELHLQAVPGHDHEVVNVGLRVPTAGSALESCAVRLMVDGRLLEMGETGYRRIGRYEELRTAMSYDDLFTMAEGSRVIGRVCDKEFRISDERLRSVQELVLRIREELTWQEEQAPAAAPALAAPDAGTTPGAATGSEVL